MIGRHGGLALLKIRKQIQDCFEGNMGVLSVGPSTGCWVIVRFSTVAMKPFR